MTQQQRDKMETYMSNQYFAKTDDERPTMFVRIFYDLANHDYNGFVQLEELEDIFMDVYADAMMRDIFIDPNSFLKKVKTYYFRAINVQKGLTQRGTKYKNVRNRPTRIDYVGDSTDLDIDMSINNAFETDDMDYDE